jgi:NADP-dependent 3-hydroxy acid dehydrogenase YdfG
MQLRGKHIWLVGASEGIGAALATQLAAAGATLVLSARNAPLLQQVAATIPAANPLVLPLDVTDNATITAAWNTLKNAPPIDMLIYNAGAYDPMDAQHFDLAKIERVVDVNLHGALRILAHVLPAFIARNAGHIALVGSVAGYRGLPASMGYGLSKAALIHLAENLRADLGRTAIGITLISPGFVKTRLTDKNDFSFEIHFPKRFTCIMKLLRYLPYGLYFRTLRLLKF